MKFGDKLREQRVKRNLRQEDVALAVDVNPRTYQNYEAGASYPKSRSVYFKFADFFKVDVNYFLTEDEEFLTEAAEKYGKHGREQAEALLEQAAAMFAGGELSEDDQIAFLHEIQGLYLDSKQRARQKFTPIKYRQGRQPDVRGGG